MIPLRFFVAFAAAVATLSAFAADNVPDSDEALANALRNNPAFVRALVDALKHDPAVLDALVREAKSGQPDGKTLTVAAPARVTASTSIPATTEPATPSDDATASVGAVIPNLLNLPKREDGNPEAMSRAMLAASPSSPASGGQSSMQLEASTGTSTATISLVIPLDTSKVNPTNPNDRVNQQTLSIKATAPIDKQDQSRATFAGVSGLPSGLTLGGDWTLGRLNNPTRPAALVAWSNVCAAVNLPPRCSVMKAKERVDAGGARQREAWNNYFSEAIGWTQIFNAHVNASHTQYKYFNAVPTAKVTDSKIGWNVGGLAGVITPDYLTFLGAGFDFAHSYKEANDSAECLVGTTPYLACTVGKFSAPTDQVHRIVSLQARRLVAMSDTWQLPIGLTVAHDLAATKGRHEDSIDLPMYLLRDKDGWFNGGVRFGWSTTDHFVAGIFVGSRFSLEPTSN